MNERKIKIVQLGDAFAVILPVDWCRWNRIRKGMVLQMIYDGSVVIKSPREKDGSTGSVGA